MASQLEYGAASQLLITPQVPGTSLACRESSIELTFAGETLILFASDRQPLPPWHGAVVSDTRGGRSAYAAAASWVMAQERHMA